MSYQEKFFQYASLFIEVLLWVGTIAVIAFVVFWLIRFLFLFAGYIRRKYTKKKINKT